MMLRNKLCLGITGLGLVFTQPAEAGKKHCETCPPSGTIEHYEVAPEGAAPAPMDAAEVTPEAMDAFEGAYDVASSSNVMAPNMFGDFFGQGFTRTNVGGTVSQYVRDPATGVATPARLLLSGGNATFVFTPEQIQGGAPSQPTVSISPASTLTQGQVIATRENSGITEGITSVANPIFVGGQAVPTSLGQQGPPFPGIAPGENGPAGSGALVNNDQYFINNTYEVAGGLGMIVNAPAPGATISAIKISENNSPMPRDRFYFNYNHFNHAFGDVNVNRYTFGVEKTFFSGNSSVDLRIPFASTLDATQVAGGQATSTEFGNIGINLKQLLYVNDSFALSAGTGITTPTASDTNVFLGTTRIVQIQNDSVHVLPYLGALWTPEGSRWFAQGFAQLDFDTNGNPANVMGTSARLNAATFAYLDGAVGYFLYQDPDAEGLNAITPIAELHWNTSLQSGDSISAGNVAVGDFFSNVDIINLTLGATAQCRQNIFINVGWVTPLTNGVYGRQFNWEAQAQVNIRYGRSRVNAPLAFVPPSP